MYIVDVHIALSGLFLQAQTETVERLERQTAGGRADEPGEFGRTDKKKTPQ